MITLEEIIINRGDIEKIYCSSIAITLWRALNVQDADNIDNPLYPDFEPRKLPNGDIRQPDVKSYTDKKSGVSFVASEEGMGTSLVDKPYIFGNKKWEYLVIPAGTVIPEQLVITKDHYMPRKECWHYSISPNYDMPVADYKAALDQLAINANIKLRQQNARFK